MRIPTVSISIIGAIALFFGAEQAFAADFRAPEVKTFSTAAPFQLEDSFLAFHEQFPGGGSVALGDLNGDGTLDIVVGAGPGGGPQVRTFLPDGTPIAQFFVYPHSFRGGLNVASCDFDGDGTHEIVTGAGQGGGPHVRILDGRGEPKFTPGFFAYHPAFRGGVTVACGDVNGDGSIDIVTGVGTGAEPHVKVFTRYGAVQPIDIRPYASRDQGGVSVAVANVDGGPASEIVTAIRRFGRSLVKVYKGDGSNRIVGQFEGWPESVQGGFNVSGGDVDNDGVDEVLVSLASGGGPQVRAFEAHGQPLSLNFFPYEQSFRGGVFTGVGDVDGDGREEIVTSPGRNTVQGRTDMRKYIEVKLSEQRLYAYENGVVARTFLISSGVARYPTPEGTFAVQAKIPVKDYEWSYGIEHPDNYDIKDVKWNLRFTTNYYLHNAFWHNNFGHRMSHGCVNINLENSEWIYNWADVGTPVIIR